MSNGKKSARNGLVLDFQLLNGKLNRHKHKLLKFLNFDFLKLYEAKLKDYGVFFLIFFSSVNASSNVATAPSVVWLCAAGLVEKKNESNAPRSWMERAAACSQCSVRHFTGKDINLSSISSTEINPKR